MNTVVGEIADAPNCLALLEKYGERTSDAARQGAGRGPGRPGRRRPRRARCDELRGDRRRPTATTASPRRSARLWSAHYLENDGDPERALEEAHPGLALVEDADGPWIRAMMHSVAGRPQRPARQARRGGRARARRPSRSSTSSRPTTTAIQARSLLAGHAIAEGRFDEAERLIAEIERLSPGAVRLRRRLRHRHGPRGAGAGPGRDRRGAAALPRRRPRSWPAITLPGHGGRPGSSPGRSSATRPARRRTPCTAPATRAPTSSRRCAPRRRGSSTPTGRGWTTRWPAWCCTASAPGGCSSRRWTPRTPSGCWCSPSCSPTRGSPPPWIPPAPTTRPSGSRPGLTARLRAEYGERKGPDLLPEARAVAERIVR